MVFAPSTTVLNAAAGGLDAVVVGNIVSRLEGDFMARPVEWPPEQQGVCPECGKGCRIYDHREERQWRHLDNILTYLKHRITNAVAEGLNSKIQQVKSAARGFRKFENYRIAILFFCGKLDMYPQKSR
jgi:transposase